MAQKGLIEDEPKTLEPVKGKFKFSSGNWWSRNDMT